MSKDKYNEIFQGFNGLAVQKMDAQDLINLVRNTKEQLDKAAQTEPSVENSAPSLETVQLLLGAMEELSHRNARLEALSYTDSMTGVHNRRYLEERFDQTTKRMERTGEEAYLVLADLGGLKAINDNLGQQTGDEAIRAFATTLLNFTRGNEVCARIGGDEFALLVINNHNKPNFVENVQARLKADLGATTFAHQGSFYAMSSYIGMEAIREDDNFEAVLQRVGAKLNEAKAEAKHDRADIQGAARLVPPQDPSEPS